jgi:hypothetical protein
MKWSWDERGENNIRRANFSISNFKSIRYNVCNTITPDLSLGRNDAVKSTVLTAASRGWNFGATTFRVDESFGDDPG